MSGRARTGRATGIALLSAGIALLAATILELVPGDARGDGDNPADSLRYLNEYGYLYSLSGLAMVAAGVAIVTAVLGLLRLLGRAHPPLSFDVVSMVVLLGAGFLAATGVMRMQANGTVPHMQSLNQSWGESAYLVVQIAGTQGMLSMAMLALAAWLVALALVAWHRGVRWPAAVTVFPAVVLLTLLADLALPFLAAFGGEPLFVVYILSAIVGIPASLLVWGIALLLPTATTMLASRAAQNPPG